MIPRPRLTALSLAAALITSARAQDDGTLVRPDRVVIDALAHSPAPKSAQLDADAAEAARRQALAAGRATLNLDARAFHYEGLSDSTFGRALTIPAIDDRYGVSAAVTQPLYTGGRVPRLAESAAERKQAADLSKRAAAADVRLQALDAYWSWSKAHFAAEAARAAVARMEKHSADVRNQRAAGLATESEQLDAEVRLDQARLRLEESSRAAALARARIAHLTGGELPAAARPEEPSAPATAAAGPSTNRLELAALRHEVRAADAAAAARRADRRPQLALSARYEYLRPNPMTIPPADEWDDDAAVGAVVSWNLFDAGLSRAAEAEARARAGQARLRLDRMQDQVSLEAREAGIAVAGAADRMVVAEHAETSARRNREVAESLWRNGMARQAEVLDAEDRLVAAQFDRIAARADAQRARALLEHALGARE